ncbi:MAG TPA: DNA-3-methyladenine glycosylase 2 family protein [Candidatus Eisenbacteria bacterium]|nr:DNA-3-methyladenine glycosylase 2 family protein [Candidatus Eisenbacteria bacterium]
MFRAGEAPLLDARRARRALVVADPELAALMRSVGAFRLRTNELHSPMTALAEAIIYQQLTGQAAATIHGRVHALGTRGRFPTAEELSGIPVAKLRKAGLSRAKTAALKDLAAKTLDGTVPGMARLRRMPDDEIVERLTSIRGIGRWTVEMLLIFRLGRPDVLPTTDYGVRKGFARAFGTNGSLPTPKQVAERGERWRPYRTMASWYLWRALELPEKS